MPVRPMRSRTDTFRRHPGNIRWRVWGYPTRASANQLNSEPYPSGATLGISDGGLGLPSRRDATNVSCKPSRSQIFLTIRERHDSVLTTRTSAFQDSTVSTEWYRNTLPGCQLQQMKLTLTLLPVQAWVSQRKHSTLPDAVHQ